MNFLMLSFLVVVFLSYALELWINFWHVAAFAIMMKEARIFA